jgi:4-hydroxy-tetrahydrodipicolinate synthase
MPDPRLPTGVFAACLTPFHADGFVDRHTLVAHARWLLDNGCHGILLFGTTGEGLSLTADERMDALDAVLDDGLPADRLLVGTGALALPDAVHMTLHATKRGVGGVLVPPPFHYRDIDGAGVFRAYDQLIQRVGHPMLRLYFYHFPELFGVPVPFDVIQRLADAYPDQVAGVKDSSGEWDHTEALCRDFPDLQVFAGTERLLLPVLNADGAGCISATANLTAPLAASVWDAWSNDEDASDLQESLTDLRTAFAALPTIPALKWILADRHDRPNWQTVRPPLTALDDEEVDTLRDVYDRLAQRVNLPGTPA